LRARTDSNSSPAPIVPHDSSSKESRPITVEDYFIGNTDISFGKMRGYGWEVNTDGD